MSFRIISGFLKNRTLMSPKGTQTRPTSGMLRKSLFDICRPYIEGAHVLDLFAGSGAIGIEAISQGASKVTFIERDRFALDCIRKNIDMLGIQDHCKIIGGDVLSHLERIKDTFELIYIDPPYAEEFLKKKKIILEIIDRKKILKEGGMLFIEEEFPSDQEYEKVEMKNLRLRNSRRFGKSILYEFERI